jgi:FKBP-type peptidyl-prolyl cis-trans isomerase
MFRIVLAAMAALALSACNPSVKADPADPWKTLLPWNHNWAEVQKLPDGVEYIVLRKGDGKGPKPGELDQVEVNYDGRFATNGLVFDSSYERGETATFALNGVIPGWTKGLQEMQPGDMFMFWIPWDQAYGERGRGVEIPPKSDLMFKVELINVMPAITSDKTAWAKVTPWPTASADVVRRPSGLEYLAVKSGPADGASPTDADEVLVNFEGRLETVEKEEGDTPESIRHRSTVVSTFETQEPASFPVNGLTPGWNELVKLMHKGDRWMVRMPPSLLYANEGDGRIPPGATVIYEVQLEDFSPQAGAVPATPPQ